MQITNSNEARDYLERLKKDNAELLEFGKVFERLLANPDFATFTKFYTESEVVRLNGLKATDSYTISDDSEKLNASLEASLRSAAEFNMFIMQVPQRVTSVNNDIVAASEYIDKLRAQE